MKTAKQTNERLAFDQLNSRLTLKLKVLDTVKNVPPCNKMLAVCDVTCDVTAPVLWCYPAYLHFDKMHPGQCFLCFVVIMFSEEKLDILRPRLRKFNMAARSVIWSHKLSSMGYKSTFFLAGRFAKWNTFRTSYSWGGTKGLLPPPHGSPLRIGTHSDHHCE